MPRKNDYYLTRSSFTGIIRQRGEDYYESGLVGELYNTNSNIYAYVNNYIVMIGPENAYCSCPYDDNCKHMYALLLKIKEDGEPPDLMISIKRLDKNALEELLSRIIDECTTYSLKALRILEHPNIDDPYDTDSPANM
jgi:uncharacterized Zn finger protein